MEKLIELGSNSRVHVPFGKTGKGPVFNCNWRRNGKWEDHIPGALSEYIPKDERIITIEDNAELKLQGIANLVRLEAPGSDHKRSTGSKYEILIKSALRMRPDRIIVRSADQENYGYASGIYMYI